MKLRLNHRKYGIHYFIKECEIEGTFRRYGKVNSNGDYFINEDRLLKAIPKDFLKSDLKNTLILVRDSKYGSTAVTDLNLFKSWGKYFDSYSLELVKTSDI
jgi:hypothetical protein